MSKEIKEKLERKCFSCKVVFGVCLAMTIGLLIAGFSVPPPGVIDGSVLKGASILFAFAALAWGMHAIELGYDLRLAKGDASIEVHNE